MREKNTLSCTGNSGYNELLLNGQVYTHVLLKLIVKLHHIQQ